jgi:hypothetical protein
LYNQDEDQEEPVTANKAISSASHNARGRPVKRARLAEGKARLYGFFFFLGYYFLVRAPEISQPSIL